MGVMALLKNHHILEDPLHHPSGRDRINENVKEGDGSTGDPLEP